MKLQDSERGNEEWIDTSSKRVRDAYSQWWVNRQSKMLDAVCKSSVDITSIATDEDYVIALMNLFKHRG